MQKPSEKKINLLVITNLYPNPEEPNRGIFVEHLLRELRTFCRIKVICPLPWFPGTGLLKFFKKWHRFSRIPQHYEINGQTVFCLRYIAIPKMGWLHPFFLFLSLLMLLKRLKTDSIDVINAHYLFPDGVGVSWLIKFLKKPLVLSAHGTDINSYLKMPLRRDQILMALRGASRVTVVSREQEHALERCGINTEKIHLVTNGFDDKFDIQNKAEVRNELGLDGNKKILIYIGRLIKGKGIEYLLQALKNVEDNKLVQLVIVGDGGYRRELERKTAELHLQDKVSFRGEQKHDVVHRWLGASDIFCLPSLSEGCPTVVIEALACGRAVIASEVGEIPRLINDDNGILFEPANAEQIKGAIEKAMDKQWNEEKIRDSVRFATWENIAKKYYGIYERALACE